MVATLYRQRNIAGNKIETITAEDKWQDVLDLWLLDNTLPLPTGFYIITEKNSIAKFKLDKNMYGEKRVELVSWMNTDFLSTERKD